MIILIGLFVVILFVFYQTFAWGYVASIIYAWFVIPTFPHAPVLTWTQLAGVMFLVNCFVHSDTSLSYLKSEYKDNTNGFITSILSPWLTLFSAWIFKSFMF